MSATFAPKPSYRTRVARSRAVAEPAWIRWSLIAVALAFLTLFLFVPLAAVFTEALRKGFDVYLAAFDDPDALSAIMLTLLAALIAVPRLQSRASRDSGVMRRTPWRLVRNRVLLDDEISPCHGQTGTSSCSQRRSRRPNWSLMSAFRGLM